MSNTLLSRKVLSVTYALLAWAFVWAYSATEVLLFRYGMTGRASMLGICVIINACAEWMFFVPLLGLLLGTGLIRRGRPGAGELVFELLRLFAVSWVLLCLLAWECQKLPHISLRGFS
jgi:hypothetical protein